MKELLITILIFTIISVIMLTSYSEGVEQGYKAGQKIIPSAMDVYQGKTTLQYTIVDGIKIDSIVVYKK